MPGGTPPELSMLTELPTLAMPEGLEPDWTTEVNMVDLAAGWWTREGNEHDSAVQSVELAAARAGYQVQRADAADQVDGKVELWLTGPGGRYGVHVPPPGGSPSAFTAAKKIAFTFEGGVHLVERSDLAALYAESSTPPPDVIGKHAGESWFFSS